MRDRFFLTRKMAAWLGPACFALCLLAAGALSACGTFALAPAEPTATAANGAQLAPSRPSGELGGAGGTPRPLGSLETPAPTTLPSETLLPTSTSTPSTTPPLLASPTVPSPTAALTFTPSPTPPRLVSSSVAGGLTAFLLSPDYRAGVTTSLLIQVLAYDPNIAKKDGAGIKSVDFELDDDSGTPVYEHTETNPSYCAFGGDEPTCLPYVFKDHAFKWPNGKPILNGDYSMIVNIHPARGNNGNSGSLDFTIKLR